MGERAAWWPFRKRRSGDKSGPCPPEKHHWRMVTYRTGQCTRCRAVLLDTDENEQAANDRWWRLNA